MIFSCSCSLLGHILLTKTEPFGVLAEEGVSDEALTVIASRFLSESGKSILPLMHTITETLKRSDDIIHEDEDDID